MDHRMTPIERLERRLYLSCDQQWERKRQAEILAEQRCKSQHRKSRQEVATRQAMRWQRLLDYAAAAQYLCLSSEARHRSETDLARQYLLRAGEARAAARRFR